MNQFMIGSPRLAGSRRRSLGLSITLGLATVAALVVGSQMVATAQTAPAGSWGVRSQTTDIRFNPQPGQSVGFAPQGTGAPRRTATGGRRSASLASLPVLLLPPSQGALTVADRPNFWVYVPAGTTGEGHFRLTDADQNDLSYQTIALPTEGGLVQITLPDTVAPLETGKTYRWFFSVMPDTTSATPVQDVFASGWIERTNLTPEATQALQGTTGRDRAAILAQAGIWQDTVDVLAQLRQQDPHNSALASDWDQLMQQVHLDNPALLANAASQE